MKKLFIILALLIAPFFMVVVPVSNALAATASAQACSKSFFGLPTWYEFLTLSKPPNCEVQMSEQVTTTTTTKDATGNDVTTTTVNGTTSFKDIWLIVLAIIDILMTVAGVVGVIFVIVGGFKYVTSTGTPEKVSNAKNTILYAVVGVVVAIVASQIVGFIGHKLGT